MFEKEVIIDCKGHLLGRLAARIAKELLCGQKIVCVKCEQLEISGSFMRNRVKYMAFLRKRCSVNPKRGPFHFKAPSKILWRTVRGMLPHKLPRGQNALGRLKVLDGVPPPFDKRKKSVIPTALRILRLRPGRRFTVLGELSKVFGWRYADVLNRFEDKRKLRGDVAHARKLAVLRRRNEALDRMYPYLQLSGVKQTLHSSGYIKCSEAKIR